MSDVNKETIDNVISLDPFRQKKLSERRKNTHRVVFQNVFSTYAVLSEKQMITCRVLDISTEGVAFSILARHSAELTQPTMTLRMYLTKETFFEVTVEVRNRKDLIIEGQRALRYGCAVPSEQPHHHVFKLMVEFMTRYANEAKIDARYTRGSF